MVSFSNTAMRSSVTLAVATDICSLGVEGPVLAQGGAGHLALCAISKVGGGSIGISWGERGGLPDATALAYVLEWLAFAFTLLSFSRALRTFSCDFIS